MFVPRRQKRNDKTGRNARRNASGTLALYNSVAMSVLLGGGSRRTRILALTLAGPTITLAALGLVFHALDQAAGVQDSPYAASNGQAAMIAGSVGAVIAARRPRLLIGWLLSAAAGLYAIDALAGEFGPYAYRAAMQSAPQIGAWTSWLASWVWVVGAAGYLAAFALFPTGQLPSAGWRVVAWGGAIAFALLALADALPPGPLYWTSIPNPAGVVWAEPLGAYRGTLWILALLVTPGATALSVLFRFRHARGLERQQLKWFVYGLTTTIAIWATASVIDVVRHETAIVPIVDLLAFVLIFGGVAAGILRYRLFDIDVVINRTLVYGIVTALLAGAFAALSILTQRLTLAVTGQESQAAVVLAALVVTALFQPLRARVQTLVDQRFYRARYDAGRTLERFGGQVRNEVELDHLARSLVMVVNDTMQPAHTSLWLRPMSHANEPK